MNKLTKITILGLLAVAFAFAQQNTIVQTSLSAAITATQTSFAIASATGVSAPSFSSGTTGSNLYIVDPGQNKGELVAVKSISGTTVTVSRGQLAGSRASAHVSGAMVLVATAPNWFVTSDPQGACTTASTYATPVVNVQTGAQWICSSKTLSWVPGWGNFAVPAQVTTATATASAAGATAIAAPLLHISGTNAITSFTMGIGWQNEGFCAYPDAAFTGTATNNIAKAFTAVADRILCFTYDSNAAKFSPSY